MDLRDSDDDRAFRDEIRAFLEDGLSGEFRVVRGRGGPGDEDVLFDERLAWEKHLARHRWTCVAWPEEHGGRGLPLRQQVIYHEEYARAGGPGRLGLIGEGLIGPTIIAFGTPEQQKRFLPPIVAGEELWCQGYSEPDAGSDLANIQTRAVRDGDEWVVDGQKVWTSLAHWSDWCFVLARTSGPEPAAQPGPDAQPVSPPGRPGKWWPASQKHVRRHHGISYLLVPMRQEGVEIRPIVQLTGDREFNEVFFDGARTPADHVVGDVDDGWRVAMGTLAFERGALTLGQQLNFRSELDEILRLAAARPDHDPVLRQRLVKAHIGLEIMRLNALRSNPRTDSINKLYWATLHRSIGELAMDVIGAHATAADVEHAGSAGQGTAGEAMSKVDRLQRMFLFSRADTIYGGSNQVQRNIIGERVLGLPKEPK